MNTSRSVLASRQIRAFLYDSDLHFGVGSFKPLVLVDKDIVATRIAEHPFPLCEKMDPCYDWIHDSKLAPLVSIFDSERTLCETPCEKKALVAIRKIAKTTISPAA